MTVYRLGCGPRLSPVPDFPFLILCKTGGMPTSYETGLSLTLSRFAAV